MLEEHHGYVADRIRLERFEAAVAKSLQPGCRVADVGCGSGILSLLCLRAGAARVYCIDATPMIDVAEQTLVRAGFGEQASFVRGWSHHVSLPEPVDLIICDHVGYFGFDYGAVETLSDARRRFLKEGGSLIPRAIILELAAVESERGRQKAERWASAAVPPEFHWLRRNGINAKHSVELTGDELLSAPVTLGEIDFRTDSPKFLAWSAELLVTRDGVMHGVAGWFDCALADGISMTNSPLSHCAIDRSQAFFPIDEAVQVKAGDRVNVRVMARPEDQMIAWTVDFPASGLHFHHSTWEGMLLATKALRRLYPGRVPQLTQEGRARYAVLGYCDGQRSAQQIGEVLMLDHPDLFPTPGEFARFVARVLERDSEQP